MGLTIRSLLRESCFVWMGSVFLFFSYLRTSNGWRLDPVLAERLQAPLEKD